MKEQLNLDIQIALKGAKGYKVENDKFVINLVTYLYDKVQQNPQLYGLQKIPIDPIPEQLQEVLDYLNEKAKSSFTLKNKKTKELIIARFNDGYKLPDFKLVIDRKVKQWLNTDQAKYIRPITLFAQSKFETYLNEVEKNEQSRFNKYEQSISQAKQHGW